MMSPKIRLTLAAISLLLWSLSDATAAKPPCEFENLGRRMISPTNPADWRCMNLLAKDGDAWYQFYVGLQLIDGFDPSVGPNGAYEPKKRGNPEGIALLRAAARAEHRTASANAMNALGRVYLSDDYGVRDLALAYQWHYLASQQPLFADGFVFDERFARSLSPEDMVRLRKSAGALLEPR